MTDVGEWLKNGKPLPGDEEADRGLQFGDGLFETMAARDGDVPLMPQHLDRLLRGCERLGLTPPSRALVEDELNSVIPTAGRAVIKLVFSAGSGGRGYLRPASQDGCRYIARFPWPDKQAEHLSLLHCRLRLARQPMLAGIKHCNRLEQVLARQEVAAAGHDEGLLMDTDEQVIEGVAANIFAVRDNRLMTPKLDQAGVAGIMREQVLAISARGPFPAEVTRLGLDDILNANEVFMTNSLIGVRPVHRLESGQHQYHWNTGPITARLQAEINEWL